MTFGERLKNLREQRNVSQKDLAKLIGVSQTVISSYECDKSKPKFEHIVPIAQSLNISLNVLFNTSTIMDDEWTTKFLYTTRDRLANSGNPGERNAAQNFDFVIKEMEREKKRIEKMQK